MQPHLILYIFLLVCASSIAQEEFKLEELSQPSKYGPEIRERFQEFELAQFDTTISQDNEGHHLFMLRNGLRSSNYINSSDWATLSDSAEIVGIDIVFSKYPIRKKNGYQMNMPLLCNRLKKLFEIDPNLNDDLLEWNIILQTDCKYDEQVDSLFHGIVIHYKLPQDNTPISSEDVPEEMPDNVAMQDTDEDRQDKINKMVDSGELPDSLQAELEGKSVLSQEQIVGDFYASQMTEEDPEITPEYLKDRKKDVTKFTKTYGSWNKSNVIEEVFNRNPQWTNSLVVSDWTGSMYGYGGKVLEWHIDNFERSGIKHITLFNDGDRKAIKPVGSTGGIYHVEANEMKNVIGLYKFVMTRGGGGDGPENDLEGILEGMEHFGGEYDEVILIADNFSCVRDMSLIENIDVPIHVIICGYDKNVGVNPQYVEIAMKTGGSIHTIEEDLYDIDADLDKKGGVTIEGSSVKVGVAPCFGSWLGAEMFRKTVFTDLKKAKKNKRVAVNLDLSKQGYKRVNQSILGMNKLQTLIVSENMISSIPGGIRRLRELKTFDAHNNNIEKIPEGLAEIRYIKFINLSENKIRIIPKTLFRLRHLEHLDLSFNQIARLPNPALMQKLLVLNLSNNQLKEIPKEIGRLKKLKQLNLSNNNLETLPATIGNLKGLEILDLSNNNIKELPIKLARLRNLKVLILTGNSIEEKNLKRIAKYLPNCKIVL